MSIRYNTVKVVLFFELWHPTPYRLHAVCWEPLKIPKIASSTQRGCQVSPTMEDCWRVLSKIMAKCTWDTEIQHGIASNCHGTGVSNVDKVHAVISTPINQMAQLDSFCGCFMSQCTELYLQACIHWATSITSGGISYPEAINTGKSIRMDKRLSSIFNILWKPYCATVA